MCAKLLTKDEIKRLKQHPAVVDANERFVHFTVEFKERFYQEYQAGKKPKRIIREMGLDPELLGKCRINSIKLHVLKEVKKKDGFTDLAGRTIIGVLPDKSPEARIRRLEHELAYTRQELEFVKKIVAANREAKEEWESKRHPMSSTGSSGK